MNTEHKCGTCRWWHTNFCVSIEVMQHLKALAGTWKNFVERAAEDEPLLERCWDKGEERNRETPGSRPRHTVTSTSTMPSKNSKSGAFETIDTSTRNAFIEKGEE